MRKTFLQEGWSCSVQKKRSKKHQICEKWDNFENQPACKEYSPWKGYSLWKMVSLGQKLKMQKRRKKNSVRTWKLCCAINRSIKHQIFEKWDNFENQPACKEYIPWKGYRLWKMVSLDRKLKMQKTRKKNSVRTWKLYCAINRSRKHQIFKKGENFESKPACKGYSLCTMVTLGRK